MSEFSDVAMGFLAKMTQDPTRPPEPGGEYADIRANFTRERMRRTRWADRKDIQALLVFERAVFIGIETESQARLLALLREKYAAEFEAIREEFLDGRAITEERFAEIQRRVALEQAEEQARRQALRAERQKEEEAKEVVEREKWLEMGGLP